MFSAKTYNQRRSELKKQLQSGIVLFLGNEESPMNYPANTYHFRQDSSFLYFCGLDSPGLAAIIDVEENKDILFGDDVGIEDIIWMGFQPSMKSRAKTVGVTETAPMAKLEEYVKDALVKDRKVHFLPPYRMDTAVRIGQMLGLPPSEVKAGASVDLIRAVVALRSVKSAEEVAEMEAAHIVTYKMYLAAMKKARPGLYESDLSGLMEGIAYAGGASPAFPIILTINGQILHNHYHGNKLERGRLCVIDAGAESCGHYACDITRTIPVNGRFTTRQKEIYEIVLDAQETAIRMIKPGVMNRDIHLTAAKVIASGLKALGLMKGDVDEAVQEGAHALFFPHGLGHMIGLDVHDMENLGENYVGYDETVERSRQFGFAYLRMAKALQPGHAITVEPGLYFIPALIDLWRKEKKFTNFINYAKVAEYKDFGGARVEDDVVVTKTGNKVVGRTIPKTVKAIEAVVGTEE
jgi:Xaa-Pro aminopeptidase